MWILLMMTVGITPMLTTQEFVSENACFQARNAVVEAGLQFKRTILATCVHDSDLPSPQ